MYSTAHDAQVFLVHILSQLEHRIALLLPKEERQKAVKFMAYAQAVSDEFRTYMMRYGLELCSPAGRQVDDDLSRFGLCLQQYRHSVREDGAGAHIAGGSQVGCGHNANSA